MKVKIFNVIWQTLKEYKPTDKKNRINWALIRWLIKLALCVYKILKFFFDERGSP